MKLNKWLCLAYLFLILFVAQSCGNEPKESNDANTENSIKPIELNVPNFNSDSAFHYIEQQLSFGFRIPGTIGQKKCANWMEQKLKSFCDTVYRQSTTVKSGDGKNLDCINLIASINPNAKKRILLLTHWDSRPWADEDDSAQTKPILAADDAASGVGVLIEISRQLQAQKISPELGIDIFLTDVEDYGKTEWGEDSYCLGTQYWARNPHIPNYRAEFGILLDMVGAKGATFPLELISAQYAGDIQTNVYQAAQRAGFSSYFPFLQARGITDDHKYVNEIIRIPTIDIININANSNDVFKPHWHTHDDNIQIIDKATLKAVGQTLLQVIYESSEQQNKPA
jgi:hypothetical protein